MHDYDEIVCCLKVGLAVDDIKEILESAELTKIESKVNAHVCVLFYI